MKSWRYWTLGIYAFLESWIWAKVDAQAKVFAVAIFVVLTADGICDAIRDSRKPNVTIVVNSEDEQ